MIDTTSPFPNQPVVSNKKGKTAIMISVIFIVAALIVGTLMLRQSKDTGQAKDVVVEKKELSPTEKPKIDKNLVKVQVLNGTGTPGQAGIVVEVLKTEGYSADNIKADNAEEFNNTVTTITAKDGFDDVANEIKNALKTSFDEIEINSTHLDKDNEFDIIITTGGEKYEETPTPTTISTPSATLSPTQIP